MHKAKKQWLAINVLGGVAVLGSYAQGLLTHPDTRNVLWGDVPELLREVYSVTMWLATAGYLVFMGYVLLRVDFADVRVGRRGFGVINACCAAIVVASALWSADPSASGDTVKRVLCRKLINSSMSSFVAYSDSSSQCETAVSPNGGIVETFCNAAWWHLTCAHLSVRACSPKLFRHSCEYAYKTLSHPGASSPKPSVSVRTFWSAADAARARSSLGSAEYRECESGPNLWTVMTAAIESNCLANCAMD